MMIGDKPLAVKRITTSDSDENVLESQNRLKSMVSRCIALENVILLSDMWDDQDFDDVAEDTENEMQKYGKVIWTVCPKPRKGVRDLAVGKIFIKFESITGSTIALSKMGGRKYDGREVIAKYYPEEKFENELFE